MSEHENPPAFPTTKPLDGWGDPNQGMTLRDWFAGQALAGFCSMADNTGMWSWPQNAVAEHAYQVADAMLAARAQQ